MKKIVALLLGIMLVLASVSAFAEDVKLGQVQYAAHGKQSFAVITAAVQGDTVVAAWIDEFQVMSGEGVVGVPNSDATFGANIVGNEDGKVLGSKRVNNAYYSGNMASRGGATQELVTSWTAIEEFVAGKTITELEAFVAQNTGADIVSGATLADTANYIKGIIEAAKVAADVQVGVYTVYNVSGETVKELYITVNETGEKSENLAGEGMEAGACVVVTKSLPNSMEGGHALTFAFTTESGYTGTFDTLSIEVAPIYLLSADMMTGATQISFRVPQQTGAYTITNLTGETVKELYIAVNATGEQGENLAGEGLAADAAIDVTKSIPVTLDGHGALTLTFVTESGYTGTFETLSIEEAPIYLLSADLMTGATQISFRAPEAK
jgi:uncharacterized protein (DUF736 family)